MKIFFLLLCGFLRGASQTVYNATFDQEVPGTDITALTVTADAYWVKNDQGALGKSIVSNVSAFNSQAMVITPTTVLWFSDGNTKTSYSDVTLSVRAGRIGASVNEFIYGRVGDSGATSASFFHDCYACGFDGTNLVLYSLSHIGGTTALSTTAAGTITQTDHVIKLFMFGSSLKCSIADGDETFTASATDSTNTTGGIGMQCFSVAHAFDDILVTQFVTPTPSNAKYGDPSKTYDQTRR